MIELSSIPFTGGGRASTDVLTFRAAAANVNEMEGSLQCPLPSNDVLMDEGTVVVQGLGGRS